MKHLLGFFCLQLFILTVQAKPVEIIFWHSLAGQLGQQVQRLATAFNQSQEAYSIKTVYKGEYVETLTSFAAAFRAKQAPAIVQIFEVGRGVMLSPQGIIKPLNELLQEQGVKLPKEAFFPALHAFYSQDEQLQALPFNTSIPIMYYNADALAKVGYDHLSFPKTWDEMEILASKLKQAGFPCVYTSAYPAWIQIEAFSALHGLAMMTTNEASYNNKRVLSHLERLKRWQRQHYFEYGGRANDATILFTSSHCPLFSQSSGSYNSLVELASFKVGVAVLPFDSQAVAKRHSNIVGGAALWVVSGQSQDVYKGVISFFVYLNNAEVQADWYEQTGYLPNTFSSDLITSKAPILALAKIDLANPGLNELDQSLGPQNQIRAINEEALEAIFAGLKTPKQALEQAVKRANYALTRFHRNTKNQN